MENWYLDQEQIETFFIDWIELIHAARTESEQHERLREIFNMIEDCLDYKRFDALDGLLEYVDQEQTSTFLITGILRGTFRARKILKNWSPFRDRAIDTIQKRGEDPKILVGLLDK